MCASLLRMDPDAPSMLPQTRDYISGELLCNHGDSVLKMKEEYKFLETTQEISTGG